MLCDAPARAFISGTPSHTSKHGCAKCTQVARKIDKVLTYASESGDPITNADFANRKYPEHHSVKYLQQKLPLENISLSMVTQIPLDLMHLIDLGVMRKFLLRIMNNKICYRVENENKNNISGKLTKMRNSVPKEFARKPRSLDDLMYWKATEYRQFLLYTGIVALRNEIHDDLYYEFILLHVSYRLLCCPKQHFSNLETAQTLLNLFVQNFSKLFGENSISYNVHSLLHVKESVELVGNPTAGSAYGFENYLQALKKMVKKPNKILEQINRNLEEQTYSIPRTQNGPKLTKNNKCLFRGCTLYTNSPDNYCYIKGYVPFKIKSFSRENGGAIIGHRFLNLRNFYTDPCKSVTLGIYLTDPTDYTVEERVDLKDLECKAVAIQYNNELLLIPMLHSCY